MNNQLKKKNQNPQSKASQYKPTQSPLPFPWIYVCFALNLWPLQLLGVAEYFNWFIHVFKLSFKTLHRSEHRLVKERWQRLGLGVFYSAFRCNFIHWCSWLFLLWQPGSPDHVQVARPARDDCVWQDVWMGLVVKAEHVQCYQMLLEMWDPGSLVPFMTQGWWFWSDSQLDGGFKVFALRSDKSDGYLRQTLREFKTDELCKFGLGVFHLRLLGWLWGWLNLKASVICVSTTY